MTDAKIIRIRSIVADILGLAPEELSEDSGVDLTEGWDSLKNLTILMEVEQQFGHQFSPDELAEANTIRAIARRLP